MSNQPETASPQAIEEFQALMQDPAARQAFVEMKAGATQAGARPRYDRVLRVVSEEAWAVRPSYLGIITDVLALRLAGTPLSSEDIEARLSAAGQRPKPAQSAGGVAVIPLRGVIAPHAGAMDEMSGGQSLATFRNEFRQAMGSSEVGAIVLDIDSPGGVASGIAEMADEIRAARGSKRIVAVANHMAASAAYWLAASADEIVVTRSGRVGSIGVYTAHENQAAKMEAEGVETTLVSAGKYKTEGNPFEPLSDEARADMQEMVDDMMSMFVTAVAKGRGVSVADVRDGFGEGRLKMGRKSVVLGMADRVGTMDEVIEGLLRGHTPSLAPAAAALNPALPSALTPEEEAWIRGSNNTTTLEVGDQKTYTITPMTYSHTAEVETEDAETPAVDPEIEELEKERRVLSGEDEPETALDAATEPSDEPEEPEAGLLEASEPSDHADEDEILSLEAEIANLAG